METELESLVVLCSLHVSICLAIAALIYLPLEGAGGAAVLGALSVATFTVARRVSRGWHRARTPSPQAQPAGAGDD